jgi:hypothetical protein
VRVRVQAGPVPGLLLEFAGPAGGG